MRIPSSAVVFIAADGNYSNICTIDGKQHTLTLQLGKIYDRLTELLEANDMRFIRFGKSLILNSDYISIINITKQKLVMSDSKTFHFELSASADAIKKLKVILEQ